MKTKKNLIYVIYILLLAAITIFSIASTSQKDQFYLEKKVLIPDDDLGKLLVEFSIASEESYVGITQKLGFYIVNIYIHDNESSDKIKENYQNVAQNILYIAKNFYEEKYRESSALFDALRKQGENIEYDNFSNIERLVQLELFINKPNDEYNKIENRLLDTPKISSKKMLNKFIPLTIFFVIILIIFHFFKAQIIKSFKKF